MKIRRTLLVLGLILVLAGGLAWVYFAADNSHPAVIPATPLGPPTTAKVSAPVMTVEAPKTAPAPAVDAPPAPNSAATRAADDALAEPLRRLAQQRIVRLQASYDTRLAAAPDPAAHAQLEQQMQSQKNVIAELQKELTRMAEPPEDIGIVDLADGTAGPTAGSAYTLSTGETFTLAIVNNNGRGTEILLQSSRQQDGRSASSQRVVTPNPGQPMILPLADGALVVFTPMGTVIPRSSTSPPPAFSPLPPPPDSSHLLTP